MAQKSISNEHNNSDYKTEIKKFCVQDNHFKLYRKGDELMLEKINSPNKEEITNNIINNDRFENKDISVEPKDLSLKELFYNLSSQNEVYYINSDINSSTFLKQKYQDRERESDSDYNRQKYSETFDNKNASEIFKLREEVLAKHPHNVINGKVRRFSIFSRTGYFCCCKICVSDFNHLGLGVVNYFKTVKFLVFLFLIVFCLNIPLIIDYYKNDNELYTNFISKSSLINTIKGRYNKVTYHLPSDYTHKAHEIKVNFLCSDSLSISKLITINYYANIKNNSRVEYETEANIEKKYINLDNVDNYLLLSPVNKSFIEHCIGRNNCTVEIEDQILFENRTSFEFIFECFEHNKMKETIRLNYKIFIINLLVLFVLVAGYFWMKIVIKFDYSAFLKNKIFTNSYTLRLRNLKVHKEDKLPDIYNSLISHFSDILRIEDPYQIIKTFKEIELDEAIRKMIKDNYNAFIDMTNEKQTGVKYDEINNLLKTGIIEFFYTVNLFYRFFIKK